MMTRNARNTTLAFLRFSAGLLLLPAASNVRAQTTPPASQRGTVSQTVNSTVITVHYDRPSARGRVLFSDDGIIVYDALWTPGANRATILELSRPARIAGHELPAGKYGMWTIPAAGDWTLILNSAWDTHHSRYPGEETDVLRTTLPAEQGAHIETLAFYFPVVEAYSATLRMHWGDVVLPIPIEVGREQ